MRAIKQWLTSLSQREQVMVLFSAGLGVILLIYALILSPLENHLDQLRSQLVENQALLGWAQQADAQLNSVLHSGPINNPAPVESVMVAVESSLAKAKLAEYLKSVSQPQQSQATISLQAVPFDRLMDWLQNLLNTAKIKVTALKATKSTKSGMVDAQLTFEKN